MNRKFNVPWYMHVLLSLYIVWFMTRSSIGISESLLGLGLISFCMYQQYLERLKILTQIKTEFEVHKTNTELELTALKSKLTDLEEIRRYLLTVKTMSQTQAQAQNTFQMNQSQQARF